MLFTMQMEGDQKMDNEVITAPHTLAQIVKGTTAEFSHYKEGQLFYSVELEGYRYEFPIDTVEKKNMVRNFDIPLEILGNTIIHQVEIQLDNVTKLSEDIGETSFERTYKAITLMRYVRKAIDKGTLRWDKII